MAKLSVYIQPGAKKTEFSGEYSGKIKIKVAAPADDGKANKKLISFLAKYYSLRQNQIQILSGHKSRNKVILIEE